eukprot:m.32563 g.32563  ORF g.32563 m.32563 type:complete len:440 (+) comp8428_c0_seq1:91-1410(+)
MLSSTTPTRRNSSEDLTPKSKRSSGGMSWLGLGSVLPKGRKRSSIAAVMDFFNTFGEEAGSDPFGFLQDMVPRPMCPEESNLGQQSPRNSMLPFPEIPEVDAGDSGSAIVDDVHMQKPQRRNCSLESDSSEDRKYMSPQTTSLSMPNINSTDYTRERTSASPAYYMGDNSNNFQANVDMQMKYASLGNEQIPQLDTCQQQQQPQMMSHQQKPQQQSHQYHNQMQQGQFSFPQHLQPIQQQPSVRRLCPPPTSLNFNVGDRHSFPAYEGTNHFFNDKNGSWTAPNTPTSPNFSFDGVNSSPMDRESSPALSDLSLACLRIGSQSPSGLEHDSGFFSAGHMVGKLDPNSPQALAQKFHQWPKHASAYRDQNGWKQHITDLSTIHLNFFLKQSTFTKNEIADLKRIRRKRKNQQYTKRSRARRALTEGCDPYARRMILQNAL